MLMSAGCASNVEILSDDIVRRDIGSYSRIVDLVYDQPRLAIFDGWQNYSLKLEFLSGTKWRRFHKFEEYFNKIILNDTFLFVRKNEEVFFRLDLNNSLATHHPLKRKREFNGTVIDLKLYDTEEHLILHDSMYIQNELNAQLDSMDNLLVLTWHSDPNLNAPVEISVYGRQYESKYSNPQYFSKRFYIADDSGRVDLNLNLLPEWATEATHDYSITVAIARNHYQKCTWNGHMRKFELVNPKRQTFSIRPLEPSNQPPQALR